VLDPYINANDRLMSIVGYGIINKSVYKDGCEPSVSVFRYYDFTDSTEVAKGLKHTDPTDFGKFNPLTFNSNGASTTICLITLTMRTVLEFWETVLTRPPPGNCIFEVVVDYVL
jgi:hypothetical protein